MTHRCPSCGTPLADGNAVCPACKVNVSWKDGQPTVSFDAHLMRYEWPVGLLVATLAALALATVWLMP